MEDKGIPVVFWNASEQEESVPDVLRQRYAHVDTKITFFFSPSIIGAAVFLTAVLTSGRRSQPYRPKGPQPHQVTRHRY